MVNSADGGIEAINSIRRPVRWDLLPTFDGVTTDPLATGADMFETPVPPIGEATALKPEDLKGRPKRGPQIGRVLIAPSNIFFPKDGWGLATAVLFRDCLGVFPLLVLFMNECKSD